MITFKPHEIFDQAKPHLPDNPVVVEAGGPSAPYGFFVHEDLEAFHSQGEAKFISGPLRESSRFMADRIAKRITFNKALG